MSLQDDYCDLEDAATTEEQIRGLELLWLRFTIPETQLMLLCNEVSKEGFELFYSKVSHNESKALSLSSEDFTRIKGYFPECLWVSLTNIWNAGYNIQIELNNKNQIN